MCICDVNANESNIKLVSNGVADPSAYGVSYPGASFKFTVLDTSGVKRSHQGT
jgi:integrin alpha FG-GAP repeat containing protein 1